MGHPISQCGQTHREREVGMRTAKKEWGQQQQGDVREVEIGMYVQRILNVYSYPGARKLSQSVS